MGFVHFLGDDAGCQFLWVAVLLEKCCLIDVQHLHIRRCIEKVRNSRRCFDVRLVSTSQERVSLFKLRKRGCFCGGGNQRVFCIPWRHLQ